MAQLKKWECRTTHKVEKPFTDSVLGCEYYYPVMIVLAPTRGQAKAIFAEEFDGEVHFCDVRAKLYHGDEEPDLPITFEPTDLEQQVKTVLFQTDEWIVYEAKK